MRFATEYNTGLEFLEVDKMQDVSLKSKRLSWLSQEYINIKKLLVEKCSTKSDALNDELQWLCVVVAALDDKNLIVPGWSRYHASSKRKLIDPPGINTILPLLRHKVHTLNMQAQCMLLNINSVKLWNEGLTPPDTCYELLFGILMEAKYQNPVLLNDYVVLFSTLHIEQSFLGIHADLINGSGLL